jgi:IPT/TIG domain
VTLAGSNFAAGATVAVSGAGVMASNVIVVNAGQITATFTIDAAAAIGQRNVTVTTTGGTSNAVTFTVSATGSAPTLTSVTPSSGPEQTVVNVTLAGTNFAAGATVSVSGAHVFVSNVRVFSATQIAATFSIGGAAAAGAHNVTVTTAGGTSNAVTFTVP